MIASVYWLSTINLTNYGIPGIPTDTGLQTNNEPKTNSISVTKKGPLGIANDQGGEYLVDKDGLTLYMNVKDSKQTSTNIKASCNAECEKTWLPYTVGETEPGITESTDALLSKINVLLRADGKRQYTLGNQALYRHLSDVKLGDMNGPITGDWMVAKP